VQGDALPGALPRRQRHARARGTACAEQAIRDELAEHRQHIARHGDDMPGISGWRWAQAAAPGDVPSAEADSVELDVERARSRRSRARRMTA
jgi:hypothetical protein